MVFRVRSLKLAELALVPSAGLGEESCHAGRIPSDVRGSAAGAALLTFRGGSGRRSGRRWTPGWTRPGRSGWNRTSSWR